MVMPTVKICNSEWGWYCFRELHSEGGLSILYLHNDGRWLTTAGNHRDGYTGYFETKEMAEAVLDTTGWTVTE